MVVVRDLWDKYFGKDTYGQVDIKHPNMEAFFSDLAVECSKVSVEDIKDYATTFIEDAYKAFEKRYGYDPRHSNDSLYFSCVYGDELYYNERTPHNEPYSISVPFSYDEVKLWREIQKDERKKEKTD